MAGIESRTRCSSSLMGPVRAVTRCGTMRRFLRGTCHSRGLHQVEKFPEISSPLPHAARKTAAREFGSAAHFAFAQHHILQRGQPFYAHRPAGVELVGAEDRKSVV